MYEWDLIITVMLIEALMHYLPWRQLLKGRDLPRPAAYILGVLGLMVPFTVWLIRNDLFGVAISLWRVIVAGGLVVMALYGLDHYIHLAWRDLEATERERAGRDADVKA